MAVDCWAGCRMRRRVSPVRLPRGASSPQVSGFQPRDDFAPDAHSLREILTSSSSRRVSGSGGANTASRSVSVQPGGVALSGGSAGEMLGLRYHPRPPNGPPMAGYAVSPALTLSAC